MASPRRWILIAVAASCVSASAWAKPATTTRPRSTRAVAATPAPATERWASHPLLPPPVDVSGLFPDLGAQQRTPVFAPHGLPPLYTQEEWDAYRQAYGAEVDDSRRRSSGYLELSAKLIAAAEVEKRPGLRRLLLVRAVAISFRQRDGWSQAGRALESYQRTLDTSDAAQLGALWTMADTLSRYATTPRPERIKCSAAAAKANVGLSLMLLDYGQIDAAQALIKKAAYHEGWLKNERHIKSQIAGTRSLINSTGTLMSQLLEQYHAVVDNKDESAALRLYLYARFVRSSPRMAEDLEARRKATEIHTLSGAMAAADKNPLEGYAAAELLRRIGMDLPDGVLRQRTLYAAIRYYRIFLRDPSTEGERVKRTLAQMQIQNLASDGARGPITIRPFDPPPAATQPATQPAARGVRPVTAGAGSLRATTPRVAPGAPTTPALPAGPAAPRPVREAPAGGMDSEIPVG